MTQGPYVKAEPSRHLPGDVAMALAKLWLGDLDEACRDGQADDGFPLGPEGGWAVEDLACLALAAPDVLPEEWRDAVGVWGRLARFEARRLEHQAGAPLGPYAAHRAGSGPFEAFAIADRLDLAARVPVDAREPWQAAVPNVTAYLAGYWIAVGREDNATAERIIEEMPSALPVARDLDPHYRLDGATIASVLRGVANCDDQAVNEGLLRVSWLHDKHAARPRHRMAYVGCERHTAPSELISWTGLALAVHARRRGLRLTVESVYIPWQEFVAG